MLMISVAGTVLVESDIYSICRCYWKVATYKRKDHNWKMGGMSFVVKLHFESAFIDSILM
jgi:hypothetical protein